MGKHIVEIVTIGPVRPHPNADRMQITDILGWSCCIGKDQFKEGDKAIYVEPDYLVPLDRPEFAFLRKPGDSKTHERIRVRRFRGTLSQGLLIPVPTGLADRPAGANVIDELGIKRYEPPEEMSTGGQYVPGPAGLYAPKFDVENLQRYAHVLSPGEEVVVTEKIHGANARYAYAQNDAGEWAQYCGSRTNWMADDEKNIWWQAFRRNDAIGAWCKSNPGKILYGEVYGAVQNLKYGHAPGQVSFRAFAILDKQRWLDWSELESSARDLPIVPVLYRGPFSLEVVTRLADADSAMPGDRQISEGVVILPVKERWDAAIGRVILKLVSNRYLEM